MTFTSKLTLPTFTVAIAAALAGCAGTPPADPQITHVQSELTSAYSDKYVAEYAQADLENAETSLAAARTSLKQGENAAKEHNLTMAEGYITLSGIHGQQERVKAETIALRTSQDQIRLSARDRDVATANNRADNSLMTAAVANVAAQDANQRADASQAQASAANVATQNANDRADASQADTLQAQAGTKAAEAKLAAMHAQLQMYDMRFTDTGATLVLHDVLFDVNSSILRDGAVTRLDPLVNYLRANPGTSVRVDGHTDSSGSVEGNRELSLDRADAVKRALSSTIAVANNIETHGYGQSRPVASNATVSGREQN